MRSIIARASSSFFNASRTCAPEASPSRHVAAIASHNSFSTQRQAGL